MPKEETKEAKEPKKPTPEEQRKSLLKEMEFHASMADKMKRIKDAGMLDMDTERQVKETMDSVIRGTLGIQPKPPAPIYTPVQPQPANTTMQGNIPPYPPPRNV